MYFDTHAHYDDEAFDGERDELLSAMPAAGVQLILNPGCNAESSKMAIQLAEKFPYVYAAVGWHPQDADTFDSRAENMLRSWAALPKVVAIGEIGLDYHYEQPGRDIQQKVLIRQMELADELGLPVIIHDREAHADCLRAAEDFRNVRGVFHCYSGSAEMAKRLLSLGWYLSFTGAITFPKARQALETIDICPIDRIMLETDSPYLTPSPHRGKRNDSRMLTFIAQTIAERKGMTLEQVAEAAAQNGRRFFGISS